MNAKLEKVRKRLEAIAKANDGRLEPGRVVEDARNPLSPLHDRFTWDDTEAADKYRLIQAASLIRSITLELHEHRLEFAPPQYVKDPTTAKNAGGGYRDVRELRTEHDVALEALVAEIKRVDSMTQRMESVAAVLGLSAEIDDLRAHIAALHHRVAPAA